MSSKGDSRQGKSKEGSISEAEVHSANSWETADLGDQQRNQKFLRLMGASKKEHHGKIIIGDKTVHTIRKEEKHRADELEEQYEHSMEHCLVGGRKGHLGLGYHPEKTDKKEEDKQELDEEVGVKAKEEESEEYTLHEQRDTENNESTKYDKESLSRTDNITQKERKRQSLDESSESDVKKMKFVKSSP
uniref:Small acidic protein n=1 Tax=Arion vulgaris TaxID=1028688 RepID=A0A0B7BD23_9EUPU